MPFKTSIFKTARYRPTIVVEEEEGESSSSNASLYDVSDTCVFDLDATIAASYSGTGTSVLNLVATPADGAAQSAYDTTTSSLTFNGTAGDGDAYFTGAGKLDFAANTTFLKGLHKSGVNYTIYIVTEPLGRVALMTTTGDASASDQGIWAFIREDGTDYGQLSYSRSTGGVTALVDTTDFPVGGTGFDVWAFVVNKGASPQIAFYKNGTLISELTSAQTWGTSDPLTTASILGGLGLFPAAGNKWRASSMFNAAHDATTIAAIGAAYETRHGQTYS